MGMPGDIVRMPAQVVSGIGFLGAGSIIVTGKHSVRGLTTTAGLWASACMGLAAGAGYYECAILMSVLIYIALVTLNKLDATYVKSSKIVVANIEMDASTRMSVLLKGLSAGTTPTSADTKRNWKLWPKVSVTRMLSVSLNRLTGFCLWRR